MNKKVFVAEKNYNRADILVCEISDGKTRSAVKRLFESGFVYLNGKAVKPAQEVKSGDKVEVTFPDAVEYTAKPEDIPVEIIYEDEDLAVVNKPQGMTVHLGNGNIDGTLVNALLYKLDKLSGINGVIRPGIVHRIDKDTSGLLVVAKNDKAHLCLSKQISEKTCKTTRHSNSSSICRRTGTARPWRAERTLAGQFSQFCAGHFGADYYFRIGWHFKLLLFYHSRKSQKPCP